MCNIIGQLEKIFTKAVLSAYPQAVNPVIQIQLSKHADYQCNAAMALAKVCFYFLFFIFFLVASMVLLQINLCY